MTLNKRFGNWDFQLQSLDLADLESKILFLQDTKLNGLVQYMQRYSHEIGMCFWDCLVYRNKSYTQELKARFSVNIPYLQNRDSL